MGNLFIYKVGHWFAMTNGMQPNIQSDEKTSKKSEFGQVFTYGEWDSQNMHIAAY